MRAFFNSFLIGWYRAMMCAVFPFVVIGEVALFAWDALQERIDAAMAKEKQ